MFSSCEKKYNSCCRRQQALMKIGALWIKIPRLLTVFTNNTAKELLLKAVNKNFQQRRVKLILSTWVSFCQNLSYHQIFFHIGQFIYFSGITNCGFDRKIEINERRSILLSAIYWEFYFPFWHFVVLGFFPKWELADNQAFSNLRNSFKSKPDDRAFSMSSFTTLHPIAKLSFLQV